MKLNRLLIVLIVCLIAGLLGFAEMVHADLNDGLVAYYPFNGNADDKSGNGNDGVVNGATLITDRFGNENSAYSFDGVNDAIVVSDSELLDFGSGECTYSAWIKMNSSFSDGTWNTILSKKQDFEPWNGIRFIINKDRTAHIQFDYGPVNNVLKSESTVSPGIWYNFVIVKNASDTISLHINNSIIDSLSNSSGNTDTNVDLWIGGLTDSFTSYGWFFDGVIDDIRIYNRALSEAEISELYNQGAVTTPGTLKWSYQAGHDFRSSPAIGSDGSIYIGSYDCSFYALNHDGSLKWSYPTGNSIYSSPSIGSDGTIYMGSKNGKFYALRTDGSLKWSYQTGADIHSSSPSIGKDGTIYVGSVDHKLYALNPDGSLKWSYQTGGIVHSSPSIDADGTIYVGSLDNKLYALNPDGSLKWSHETGDIIISSPSIGGDGTIYVGSYDNNFYALNPDGSLKWSYQTGGDVGSSPSIGSNGIIYVGSKDSNLYALNPDGSLKWSYQTGDKVGSSPAIGNDGTIYVGSNDNKLYALNSDGSLKWSYQTRDAIISCPAIGSDGTIYVGSLDNNLYAINGNSGGLADTPWPMFRHDVKHTGRVPESSGAILNLNGPSTVNVGAISTVFILTSQDSSSNPVNVTQNTGFSLSSNSTGTAGFYRDAAGTTAISQVTIANGSSTATFYYKDNKPGTPTITASCTSGMELGSDTHQITVNAGTTTTTKVDLNGPSTVNVGEVSTVFTLTSQDASSNPTNVIQDTVFNLTSNSTGTPGFYRDALGTTAISQVTIANGSSTATHS